MPIADPKSKAVSPKERSDTGNPPSERENVKPTERPGCAPSAAPENPPPDDDQTKSGCYPVVSS